MLGQVDLIFEAFRVAALLQGFAQNQALQKIDMDDKL
jgi:hypothetical protein